MKLDHLECSIPIVAHQIREKTITEDGIRLLESTMQALIRAARISTDEIEILPYRANNVIYLSDYRDLEQ